MKNPSVRLVMMSAASVLGMAIIVLVVTWRDQPEWVIVAGTGLLILVGFGPPVVSLLGGPRRSAFRKGELGLGTLQRLRQTGVQINDQPQVEMFFDVETADGQRFDGRARQVVSLTDLPGLVPGAVLPVRYLPGRTDGRVLVDGDTTPEQLEDLLLRRQLALGRITPRQFEAAQHGVEPPAEVFERVLAQVVENPGVTPIRRRSASRTGFRVAAAAAVIVVAVAAGVVLGRSVLAGQDGRAPSETEIVLAAPDARTAQARVGDATISFIYSRERNAGVVLMKDVPPPQDGTVYQMWLMDPGGGARSRGTMTQERRSSSRQ